MRFDESVGRSRGVCEKFASDETFASARALIRDTVRDELSTAELDRALIAYGAWKADPTQTDPTLAFLGAMAAEGVWNAHDIAWDRLDDLLAVNEETATGLLVAVPRIRGLDQIRRRTDSLREYVTALAVAVAREVDLDPTSNIFLNEGTDLLWRRFTNIAATDQPFDNAHARIGIGDSTTAAARTQTGLQAATNKTFKAMEAGFPTATLSASSTEGSKTAYKSVYDGTSANYGHKEWVIDNKNSATPGVITVNRKQQDFGTKASGATWTYTFELRID